MTLDEFRKLCDAATPGPWRFENNLAKDNALIVSDSSQTWVGTTYNCDSGTCKDASFIVACREMVPKLLKVAEAAKHIDSNMLNWWALSDVGASRLAFNELSLALSVLESE